MTNTSISPAVSLIVARSAAINQGATPKQAMLDGFLALLMKQPMGLVFALLMAKNQAANRSPKVSLLASSTALTVNATMNKTTGTAGSPVAFSAKVTRATPTTSSSVGLLPAPAAPVPGGEIVFSEIVSGVPRRIGQIPLDATGTAALSNVTVPAGPHTYVAIYTGDTTFQGGSSSTSSVTIV